MKNLVLRVLWIARTVFILPIRVYQLLISPILPPSCRYMPSCSEYTAQAIERFGVARGILKGLRRILRCNPLGGSGFDPVENGDTLRPSMCSGRPECIDGRAEQSTLAPEADSADAGHPTVDTRRSSPF